MVDRTQELASSQLSPVDVNRIREDAQTELAARVSQITALCSLAGRPELAARFSGSNMTVQQVRHECAKMAAETSEENAIDSGSLGGSAGTADSMRLQNAILRNLSARNLKPKAKQW